MLLRSRHRRSKRRSPRLAVECLERRTLLTITFNFDYSLDANGFFDEAARRTALEEAGDIVTGRLEDTLSAIVAGSVTPGDSWTATYTNPATGVGESTVDLVVPENVIHVFAGGRDLGGSLGLGGPGGFGVSFFTTEWRDIVRGRGQAGALTVGSETDFGPWGGTITFNTETNWHFGLDTSGLDNDESDFLSVAIHELIHLIGIGTAPSWDNLVSGTSFTGPVSTAEYDLPGNPPLIADGSHWADGTTDNGEEAALDPTLLVGTRKLPTPLDFAGLDDLGWDIAPLPPADPFVQLDLRIRTTATSTDANGEVESIPDNVDFLDEWDEFVAEVWASTPMDDGTSVDTFTLDIAFDEQLFEVTAIEYGSAFGDNQQGTIDNDSGLIDDVSAATSETAIGRDQFALLTTVSFRVHAELPNDMPGAYIQPTIDDEFLVQAVTVAVPGGASAETSTQTAPSIEVWPLMYDIDDNGTVGFGDVNTLASTFNATTSANNDAFLADFDHNGSVGFGDISLFSGAFGRSRDSAGTQTYFAQFPDLWRPAAASFMVPDPQPLASAPAVLSVSQPALAHNRPSESPDVTRLVEIMRDPLVVCEPISVTTPTAAPQTERPDDDHDRTPLAAEPDVSANEITLFPLAYGSSSVIVPTPSES